jgi:hypothetical protein
MTMIKDGQWYAQRGMSGYTVQWRVAPGKFVTSSMDQWGRIRSTSWPSETPVMPGLHQQVKDAISEVVATLTPPKGRFGDRFSTLRWDLCERVAAELNKRGVKPVDNCQRPGGTDA